MIKYKIYNQQAEQVGEQELSEKIFGVKPNDSLIHQVAVAQMSNERTVLAHAKDRSEVSGGGRKPWKQKGTGRARVGSSNSPLWIGGGVTFGPSKDRNFTQKINKKMKRQAIFMTLSDKIADGTLVLLDKFDVVDYKTKQINEVLNVLESKTLSADTSKRSVLIIDGSRNEKLQASAKNLKNVKMLNLENINILDLLKYRNLVLTVDTVRQIEEIFISNK